MAEEHPSLQIDTDWKRQAQEEKKRLAEQQRAQPPAAPGLLTPGSGPAAAAPPAGATTAPTAGAPTQGAGARRGQREVPPPTFPTLVQSLLTQTLVYLGEIATAGGPVLSLDMAKHQLDMLTMLEEKTKNNLDEEEQLTLDTALYEGRSRFVSVASQFL